MTAAQLAPTHGLRRLPKGRGPIGRSLLGGADALKTQRTTRPPPASTGQPTGWERPDAASFGASGTSAGASQVIGATPAAWRRPALECDRPTEQQPVLGRRAGDVEDTILLLFLGSSALLAQLVVVEHGCRLRVSELQQPQPHAPAGAVDEQVGHAQVGLASEVGDAHDRELEALGRVDAHEAHGVHLTVPDGGIGLTPERRLDVGDMVEEAAQVAPLLGLEASSQAYELVNVRKSSLAPAERKHVRVVARGGNRAPDELGDRMQRRERPLARRAKELAEGSPHRAPRLAILPGGEPDAVELCSAVFAVLDDLPHDPRRRSCAHPASNASPSLDIPTSGEASVE